MKLHLVRGCFRKMRPARSQIAFSIVWLFLAICLCSCTRSFEQFFQNAPTDASLAKTFNSKRLIFESLCRLADSDRTSGWAIDRTTDIDDARLIGKAGISEGRLAKYKLLVSRLGDDVQFIARPDENVFVFRSGGVLAAGPELEKGILYSLRRPEDTVGTPANDLDNLRELPPPDTERYLRKLGGGWYIFYEELD